MATVKELIEYLQKQPQDAIVECGEEGSGGYESYMVMNPVDIDSCSVLDFSDCIKGTTFSGKIYVQLNA